MASRALIAHLISRKSDRIKISNVRFFCPVIRHMSQDKQSNITESKHQPSDDQLTEFAPSLNPFAKLQDKYQKTFLEELRPPLKKSFNLAAYVNSSKTLQELIKIGVSLFDVENLDIDAARKLVLLDFEQDCVPYLKFLVDKGLKEKNLGRFISEYPQIFHVPIDDLQVRIKYLKSKNFSDAQISKALNRSCQIICRPIKFTDYKLGQLQIEFSLPGSSVRNIVSKHPEIIALPEEQYKLTQFTLSQEFGFSTEEIIEILEQQPKILDMLRPVLIERLDLIHNIIGLSHETIVKFPKLIVGPKLDIRHRFLYLQKLKRDQFDPEKPLYVPPTALYNGSDEYFCTKYAKTNLEDYKLFLKHL